MVTFLFCKPGDISTSLLQPPIRVSHIGVRVAMGALRDVVHLVLRQIEFAQTGSGNRELTKDVSQGTVEAEPRRR